MPFSQITKGCLFGKRQPCNIRVYLKNRLSVNTFFCFCGPCAGFLRIFARFLWFWPQLPMHGAIFGPCLAAAKSGHAEEKALHPKIDRRAHRRPTRCRAPHKAQTAAMRRSPALFCARQCTARGWKIFRIHAGKELSPHQKCDILLKNMEAYALFQKGRAMRGSAQTCTAPRGTPDTLSQKRAAPKKIVNVWSCLLKHEFF